MSAVIDARPGAFRGSPALPAGSSSARLTIGRPGRSTVESASPFERRCLPATGNVNAGSGPGSGSRARSTGLT